MASFLILLALLSVTVPSRAWTINSNGQRVPLRRASARHDPETAVQTRGPHRTRLRTRLSMGLLDPLANLFLNSREGEFVKMDKSSGDAFGPGPLVLLYHVPSGIDDEELRDMLEDGAPRASKRGVSLLRVTEESVDYLDEPIGRVLEFAMTKKPGTPAKPKFELSTDAGVLAETPVLFFSGFTNREVLDSYNIIGPEIYQETGGRETPACAMAVPKAMKKPLRQVLEEIAGDHADAMKMEEGQQEN